MENVEGVHPLTTESQVAMSIASLINYGSMNHWQKPASRLANLIISILITTGSVLAEDNVKNLLLYEPDKTVYTVVEKQPEFPGGRRALEKFLHMNLQFPAAAKSAKVSGKVYIQFVVRRDGQITDVDILKGLGFGCDEEAIRLVKAMPNWIPGSQSGRPLSVRYSLPILFGMDYPKPKNH
jgi:protein TonB